MSLQKTLFILHYAEDFDLRRRIGRQLNKGEELGALQDFLFFANDGNIRKHQPEEQTDQALCLSLLVNAVILWNAARCYQEALDALRTEGHPANDEDLATSRRRATPTLTPTVATASISAGTASSIQVGDREKPSPACRVRCSSLGSRTTIRTPRYCVKKKEDRPFRFGCGASVKFVA